MIRLLKIEWLKMKNYRTFWVLMGLYVVIVLLSFYILKRVSETNGTSSLLIFPQIWNSALYIVGWGNIIIGMIVVNSICNDFQFRTYRQHVIDGLSRLEFLFAKILFILLLALLVTLFVFISILLFGFLNSPDANPFVDSSLILNYFFQLLGYLSLALLISMLFRTTGISMAFFILYTLILEQIIGWLVYPGFSSTYFIKDFLPKQLYSSLIPVPSLFSQLTNYFDSSIPSTALPVLSFVYSGLIMLLCFALLKRRDVR